jgi:sugar/nucleoside kinase (ribokinase family)
MSVMLDSQDFRSACASRLEAAAAQVPQLSAFVGLDGFVDQIIHVVDKRENAEKFDRMHRMAQLGERIIAAAGRSTNVELVRIMTKLGGNGPIMANALAAFGIQVSYVGALGWPELHPVFKEFAQRAEVVTIGEPGYTDALEFDDGKLLFGKLTQLAEINWANLTARYGKDKFAQRFHHASLVGFVNWTMLPYMSDIWTAILQELCPAVKGPRRTMFFDLCDPEKRSNTDIARAMELIGRFNQYFSVILGLNEKEAFEVARVLGLSTQAHTPEGLAALALDINRKVPVDTVLIHPTAYALACTRGEVAMVKGPYTEKPFITTGAGDHFNSGFCLGKLLGLDNAASLCCGVATSGFYVRTAKSPAVSDLVNLMRQWPAS